MFSQINSVGLFGMTTYTVGVESSVVKGMPKLNVVGLPDAAVKEAIDRVWAATKNNNLTFPNGRVTINLTPADKRKEGSFYDLPILISLLKTTNQISADLSDCAFIGELSLSGSVRKVSGALVMAIHAITHGIKSFFVPIDNASECCVVDGIDIYPVRNVKDLIFHFSGEKKIKPAGKNFYGEYEYPQDGLLDFADVKGQYQVKRALEIAAAGGHNTLMIGPPGSGKSMLAKRMPSILPDMTFEESLDVTKLFSIAGLLDSNVSIIKSRPFRSPHHTISAAGLSGGGRIPKPGEISLAHHGVLFLDELPEFSRPSLETLRQPLEDGTVTISRVSGTLTYPCDIMLICAMNPCPCGYFGHSVKKCTCPPGAPAKYLSKVSGPLLDRLDIHIEVPQVDFKKLSDDTAAESSAQIRKRVNTARKIQQNRLVKTGISCNGKMPPKLTREFCKIDDTSKKFLEKSFDSLGLSARAYDKILRVARTIADLDGSDTIEIEHLSEAVQYRSLDRKFWKE